MPPLTLFELYVADLERSRRFYTDLGSIGARRGGRNGDVKGTVPGMDETDAMYDAGNPTDDGEQWDD